MYDMQPVTRPVQEQIQPWAIREAQKSQIYTAGYAEPSVPNPTVQELNVTRATVEPRGVRTTT